MYLLALLPNTTALYGCTFTRHDCLVWLYFYQTRLLCLVALLPAMTVHLVLTVEISLSVFLIIKQKTAGYKHFTIKILRPLWLARIQLWYEI